MQFLSRKNTVSAIAGIIAALIASIARVLLMLNGFNKETLFFESKGLATTLYCFMILSVLAVYLLLKNTKVYQSKNASNNSILSIISGVIFAILFASMLSSEMPLNAINKITHWIALAASLLSVLYYLLSAFTKKTGVSSVIPYLNVAPVIYLLCFSIDSFTAVSVKANSYYLFPHTMSVIILCFYIISRAKLDYCTTESAKSVFAQTVITLQVLAFSFIPDMVLLLSGGLAFTSKDILITVLKGIYLILSICDVCFYIKAEAEEK